GGAPDVPPRAWRRRLPRRCARVLEKAPAVYGRTSPRQQGFRPAGAACGAEFAARGASALSRVGRTDGTPRRKVPRGRRNGARRRRGTRVRWARKGEEMAGLTGLEPATSCVT